MTAPLDQDLQPPDVYDEPPPDDLEEIAWDEARQHRKQVDRELKFMRAREEARRIRALEQLETLQRPKALGLAEFLARPLTDPTYRIDEVWPTGGRVVLAAQFKAGKTTLVGNVIRSLADGVPLFDRFDVRPGAKVMLIDDELDDRTLQRWLTDQQIRNPHQVAVIPLRGALATFNILDPDIRAQWAKELAGADVIILDCLRPILDALNLDEKTEAGRFLVHFDALLRECGATEALVLHHMGHSAERSRGDSRIPDWPDANWKLVRDKDDEDPSIDNVNGSRYFEAYGRDVNVTQAELHYDPHTRRLTLGDQVLNRRQATAIRQAEKADEAVIAVVTESPGINVTRLRNDVRTRHGIGRNEVIDDAVHRMVDAGRIYRIPSGNSKLHYPKSPLLTDPSAQPAQPAPDQAGQVGTNMPARPIGAGIYSHTHDHDDITVEDLPEGHDEGDSS